MPILAHSDLAKELIRRRDRAPPRQPLAEVGGNETTSYEMVEAELPSDVKGSNKSWLPHRRAGRVDKEVEKRVVSEPLGGMLSRLRLRRGSEEVVQQDRSGSIETESSGVDVLDPSEGGSRSIPGSFPPSSFAEDVDTSYDTSPSFIAFSPSTTPSSNRSSHSLRSPPRPARSPPSKRTLAPVLLTPNRSIGRAAATRAVTLEARLHPDESQSGEKTEPSHTMEYPSQIDSEGDDSGVRGILRAKHDRAPPNTPVPSVRFADTWLTSKRRYGKTPSPNIKEMDSLPAAQISGGPRWKRLGAILSALDDNAIPSPVPPTFNHEAQVDDSFASPGFQASSSDSPISFARFDPSDMTSSTPIRRPRYRKPVPNLDTPPSPSVTYFPQSDEVGTSVHISFEGRTESPTEENMTFEGCSALEALWEYGSSDGEESGDMSPPVHLVTPVINLKAAKERSTVMANTAETDGRVDSGQRSPAKRDSIVASTYDSDPFPFAKALRF